LRSVFTPCHTLQSYLTRCSSQNTLFTDPFPLVSLLLPALSSLPTHAASSNSAWSSLLLIAAHSSAKEVVLAAGEKVDELKLPADSDEEEEWDQKHKQNGPGGTAWDPKDAAVQLAVLVEMYTVGSSTLPPPLF
jgi:hypothetical protein